MAGREIGQDTRIGKDKGLLYLVLAVLAVIALGASSCAVDAFPNPGHPASEIGGGVPFNNTFGDFVFPGDRALTIPTNTSCETYVEDGAICWDTDDLRLFIGNGTKALRFNDDENPWYIGDASTWDDDYLYFNSGSDYIMWNNAESLFEISDDAFVSGHLYVGNGSESDDDVVYFDGGNEYLMWDESEGRLVLSDNVTVGDDIEMNIYDSIIQIGDPIIYVGVYPGRMTAQGKDLPGFLTGKDSSNNGYCLWNASGNYMYCGTELAGQEYPVLYFQTDRVGINTEAPLTELDVYDGADADTNNTIILRTTGSTTDAAIEFATGSIPQFAMLYDGSADELVFQPAGTDTPAFVFQNDGNMGIGHTGPDTELHVLGAACFDDNTDCDYMAPGNINFQTYLRGGPLSVMRFGVTNACQGVNTNCISDYASNSVDHADDPSDLYIYDDFEVDGQFYIDNMVTSGTGTQRYVYWDDNTDGGDGNIFYTTSSIRYKDNVTDLDDDFDKALLLRPRSFVWKDTGNQDIGYIAEEVEALGLNNLVGYTNKTVPDSVYYEKLGIYALELVKDHESRLKSLDAEIADLKALIAEKKKELGMI